MTSIGGIIAIKLFAAGLQRSVSVLFQRVARLKKVDESLRGPISRRKEVRVALADLEIVLGTYQGRLTTSLGAFLDELERSGIIDAMVQSTLLEKNSQKLRVAFAELHSRFLPDNVSEADSLYDGLTRSFEVIYREFSKDKTLFDLLRLQHSEIGERLSAIEGAIRKSSLGSPTFEEVEATVGKVAKAALQSFKHVRIETHRGAQNVEITRIYIAPKLRYRDGEAQAETVRSLGLHDANIGLVNRDGFAAEDGTEPLQIPYADVRAGFRRLVILGEPGGGKSTLCQRLCFDMAKSTVMAQSAGTRKEIPAQEQKVPIRVTLRQFEQARQQEAQLDIKTYLARDLKHGLASTTDEELRCALEYLLETGRALLAFDGLDEILDTARRREYVDLVSSFCDAHPMCPVLVTSRLVGYDFAPMGVDFEEFLLERFDNYEVAEYAKKFMIVVAGLADENANLQATRFIEQTSKNASDLRQNPLMLGLMCWLFHATGDVPTNRPEIYKECAILMFERWDPNRGIFGDVPRDFDRLQLFTYLASKIYGVPEFAGGVTKEWLHRESEMYFGTLYSDRGKAISESRALVKFLTGRAWVMSEIGDGMFAFTHQTFLEYFFARSIDDVCDRVDDVIKVVLPRIAKREWDVVTHLALQIKTYRNTRRQEEAIDALIEALNRSKPTARKKAISAFMGSALEYLSATEPAVERALGAIFANAVTAGVGGKGERFKEMAGSIRAARERKHSAILATAKLFADAIVGDDEVKAKLVARSVYAIGSATPFSHSDRERAFPWEVVDAVKARIKQRVLSKETKGAFYAAVAWSWLGVFEKEKFEGQAVEWLFRFPPIGTYVTINGLLSCALGVSDTHRSGICDTTRSKESYAKVLAHIARDGFSGRKIELNVHDSRSLLARAPADMWVTLLDDGSADLDASIGIYFAMIAQEGLYQESIRSEDPKRFAEFEARLLQEDVSERYPLLRPFILGDAPNPVAIA